MHVVLSNISWRYPILKLSLQNRYCWWLVDDEQDWMDVFIQNTRPKGVNSFHDTSAYTCFSSKFSINTLQKSSNSEELVFRRFHIHIDVTQYCSTRRRRVNVNYIFVFTNDIYISVSVHIKHSIHMQMELKLALLLQMCVSLTTTSS